jgi:acetyltransferase-like isoleucine patch superfamily enzyme
MSPLPENVVPDWHHLPPNPWNPHAWVVGAPDIGPGCWIGAFTVVDGSGGLTIGAGCDISAGAQVYTHSTVRRAVSAGRLPIERQPTVLGDHVHVGAGAVVLMGCTIGSHSVVGAGAVVLEGTTAPPWSLLVGVPARVVPDGARGLLPGSAPDAGGQTSDQGPLLGPEPGSHD